MNQLQLLQWVKEAIKDPEFEYKIFKKDDGAWAFKQMRYFKNRVFDYADKTFASASATNPFGEQTPYVRIEQKYSTMSENEMMVLELGEQNVADVAKKGLKLPSSASVANTTGRVSVSYL